jgi:hypothetical protein
MIYKCLHCLNEKTVKTSRTNHFFKYCSNLCQKEFEYNEKVKNWLSGNEPGWTGKAAYLKLFVRKWLFETRGAKCEECGWDKKHPIDGKELVEIDHIDGDAHNCTPSNLKILCPNCHSMTPNHRARNKNSSRKR